MHDFFQNYSYDPIQMFRRTATIEKLPQGMTLSFHLKPGRGIHPARIPVSVKTTIKELEDAVKEYKHFKTLDSDQQAELLGMMGAVHSELHSFINTAQKLHQKKKPSMIIRKYGEGRTMKLLNDLYKHLSEADAKLTKDLWERLEEWEKENGKL